MPRFLFIIYSQISSPSDCSSLRPSIASLRGWDSRLWAIIYAISRTPGPLITSSRAAWGATAFLNLRLKWCRSSQAYWVVRYMCTHIVLSSIITSSSAIIFTSWSQAKTSMPSLNLWSISRATSVVNYLGFTTVVWGLRGILVFKHLFFLEVSEEFSSEEFSVRAC